MADTSLMSGRVAEVSDEVVGIVGHHGHDPGDTHAVATVNGVGPGTSAASSGRDDLEDALSGPSLFQPYTCRSQRGSLDYPGEGLRLKSTGPCQDGEIVAAVAVFIRGLTILDGEVRVEAKAVSGIDRVRIGVDTRTQPAPSGGIASVDAIPAAVAGGIEPGRNRGLLGIPGKGMNRSEAVSFAASDDWITIAVRLQGANAWLLLNDQPVLYFSDGNVDRGGAFFDIVRVSDGPLSSMTDPGDTTDTVLV